jgi:anti-anti-sigma regulatory factor
VDQRFDIIRESDGSLVVRLGSRGAVDINLSSGWSAHVLAEIDRAKPPRIVIDASQTNAVASAFFSGIIRIRDRSGLTGASLVLRCGSERMREAARLLGMDQLITLES